MRVLVTGAGGFVGRHLVQELGAHGHTCIACDLAPVLDLPGVETYHSADIRDPEAMDEVIKACVPEACVHLAAITSVPEGASNPDLVLGVNVRGTLNLVHACRLHAPGCRFLFASTAHVYGMSPRDEAINETAPLRPLTMYGISKVAADVAVLACAGRYDMHTMTARPNNHTGPGQEPRFVVAAFAKQVRDIAAGRSAPVITIGNTASDRDFCDVRDVVRAYRLLLEHGRAGEAYNISSQRTIPIGEVLDQLCDMAGIAPQRVEDPALVRPTDWSPHLAVDKLRKDTGWTPNIPFEDTLRDILEAM